jgi:hypothetical protein
MKTAWGWLMAGVVALGLNGFYHDGGLAWAHQGINEVGHRVSAVLALASGDADQFLAEARLLTGRDEMASCPFATEMARVQSRIARSQIGFARAEATSARQEAQMARVEAYRARLENQIQAQIEAKIDAQEARTEAQVNARLAHLRIPAVAVNPAVFENVACSRVRVNVPVSRMQMMNIKMPAVRMPRVNRY